jgi:hypothetical protein
MTTRSAFAFDTTGRRIATPARRRLDTGNAARVRGALDDQNELN